MSSSDVTYFCGYGKWFLIGSDRYELDNFLSLVEQANGDICKQRCATQNFFALHSLFYRFISSRGTHGDFNTILEARLQRFIEVWRNKVEATLPKLKRDITGRHYNARNSDVSRARAPCGLGRGDG